MLIGTEEQKYIVIFTYESEGKSKEESKNLAATNNKLNTGITQTKSPPPPTKDGNPNTIACLPRK